MKRIVLVGLIAIFISCKDKGQTQSVNYNVTNYEINDKNFDSLAIEEEIELSFYISKSNTLYFSNQWNKSKTKSYGEVYFYPKRDIPGVNGKPRKVEYQFKWSYVNSYDNQKGNAIVTFTEIFYDTIVKFTAKIKVQNSPERIVLKGYLENEKEGGIMLKLSELYELTKSKLTSVKDEHQPEFIKTEEFENFKIKSNYIETIEAYDEKNPSELLGGKKNQDNISYYKLPTEINTKEYTSNSILFGDLNEDEKRDCIITAYRSDGYNEVAFFYVFINHGNTFKLVDVKSEDEICGCKKEGWPSLLRYQKIEDGYLKGISECHYKDAHCCPSMIFQTKVKFINGELHFHSAEFIKDDFPYKRDKPEIDSVLIESEI